MKRRMKLNNKNSKFVKSLSVAALAGLTFFGASCYAGELENQNRQTGERLYDIETSGDVYKVTENLGTTGTGKFTINGVTGEDGSKSVIDFQGHSGMNITNASDVTVKDVELVNAGFIRNEGSVMYINNANAKVNLENIYAHDNNNTSTDSYGLYGGVIYNNKGEITNISGLFENNTISAFGGDLKNIKSIEDVLGIGNAAISST